MQAPHRFADAQAARDAVALALPMIEAAARDPRICGAGFLFIVVMDPTLPPEQHAFDDCILHEHAVGDCSRWDADYAAFARAKATLSWRHRLDTQTLQLHRPHLLVEGDSLLAGGVWLDGVCVAVSGAQASYDIAFATAVAANLRAISAQRLADAVGAAR